MVGVLGPNPSVDTHNEWEVNTYRVFTSHSLFIGLWHTAAPKPLYAPLLADGHKGRPCKWNSIRKVYYFAITL